MDGFLLCITALWSGDRHLADAAARTVDDSRIYLERIKGFGTLVDVSWWGVVYRCRYDSLLLLRWEAVLFVQDCAFGLLRDILNRRCRISWRWMILLIHFGLKPGVVGLGMNEAVVEFTNRSGTNTLTSEREWKK